MSRDAGLARLFFKNVFPVLRHYYELLMVHSSQICGLILFFDQKMKRLNALKIIASFTLFICNYNGEKTERKYNLRVKRKYNLSTT